MTLSSPSSAERRADPVAESRLRLIGPALIALLAIAFIAYALPPYLALDPERSRIPPPPHVPLYYPVLAAHVAFGSIAMLMTGIQVWPPIRRRYPRAHRIAGRVYVFGGVLPAAATAVLVGIVGPFGPTLRASNLVLASVWTVCTLTGFQKGRRRQLAAHRQWMIRSAVLTMSVITNRVWAVLFTILFVPRLDNAFGGSETLMIHAIAGLSGWLGWVLPLLAAEWWLIERSPSAGRVPRGAVAGTV